MEGSIYTQTSNNFLMTARSKTQTTDAQSQYGPVKELPSRFGNVNNIKDQARFGNLKEFLPQNSIPNFVRDAINNKKITKNNISQYAEPLEIYLGSLTGSKESQLGGLTNENSNILRSTTKQTIDSIQSIENTRAVAIFSKGLRVIKNQKMQFQNKMVNMKPYGKDEEDEEGIDTEPVRSQYLKQVKMKQE
jgi:hypothetical protein